MADKLLCFNIPVVVALIVEAEKLRRGSLSRQRGYNLTPRGICMRRTLIGAFFCCHRVLGRRRVLRRVVKCFTFLSHASGRDLRQNLDCIHHIEKGDNTTIVTLSDLGGSLL
jgi:hypothetical protein